MPSCWTKTRSKLTSWRSSRSSEVCPICQGRAQRGPPVRARLGNVASLGPAHSVGENYVVTFTCDARAQVNQIRVVFASGEHTTYAIRPRMLLPGDMLTAKIEAECFACADTGLAMEAVRRRMLGLWEP